jgi:hypothetical protein
LIVAVSAAVNVPTPWPLVMFKASLHFTQHPRSRLLLRTLILSGPHTHTDRDIFFYTERDTHSRSRKADPGAVLLLTKGEVRRERSEKLSERKSERDTHAGASHLVDTHAVSSRLQAVRGLGCRA